MSFLIALIIVIAVIAVDFIISAGLIKIICWAFGFAFSWKLAIGLWVVLFILHSLFRSAKSDNK